MITTTGRGLLLSSNVVQSISLRQVINIVLTILIARYTCLVLFAAIIHWYTTNLLFLSWFILNHYGFFSPQILNMFFCDIFEHNFLLHTNKSTTFQFLIIHKVVQTLKDRDLSGSADCGEVDRASDINHLASANLRQYTTATNQCDRLSWTWMWYLLYCNCWSHLDKGLGRQV